MVEKNEANIEREKVKLPAFHVKQPLENQVEITPVEVIEPNDKIEVDKKLVMLSQKTKNFENN